MHVEPNNALPRRYAIKLERQRKRAVQKSIEEPKPGAPMKLTIAVIAFVISEYLYQEGARLISFLLLLAVIVDLAAPLIHARRIRRRLRQCARRIADGFTQDDLEKMKRSFKRMWYRWEYGSDDPKDTLYSETASALGVELSANEAKLLMALLSKPIETPQPR